MSREFGAFVLVGAAAAAVNWLSRIGFSTILPLAAAVVAAYLVGMTTAYLLNRRFVFASSGRSMRDEYGRFALVNVVAALQVIAVTLALADWLFPLVGWSFFPEATAHALGVASPIVTSYIAHRRFTFAKKTHG